MDTTFYEVPRHPGVIHVEKTGLKPEDFITVWWKTDDKWHYKKHMKLPIGESRYDRDFPNDKIDHVEIPFGVTAELFAEGGGGSLIFSGNDQNHLTHIDLHEFHYNDKVSRVMITADAWEAAGIAIENEVIANPEDKRAATITLANNSPHEAVVRQLIGGAITLEQSEEWDVGGSITAKAEVSGGIGPVEVTTGVEVEVHAGFGQSKSTSKEVNFESEAAVTIDGHGTAKASLIVEMGKMTCDAIRKWRNKRTGVIIEEHGKMSFDRAYRARVEVH